MTTTTWKALLTAGLVVATFSMAVAKLPPPPPMDEKAKAAAEEKKAKEAAAAELAKAQLTKAEDRVAARYIADQKAKGITVHPSPMASTGTGAVMTAQGNTPTGAAPGQSAEAKGPAKPAGAAAAATGPDASKDTNKK